MSLILQPPWTRQPQGAVEIDWSNPLTRGLVICTYAGNNFREMVTNKPSTITSATYAPTKDGVALKNSASSFSIETPVNTDFGNALTWLIGATPDGLGGASAGRFVEKRTAAANTQVEVLFCNGSSFELQRNGGSAQTISVAGAITTGVYANWAVRVSAFTSNADAAMFKNGVSLTLTTNTAGTGSRTTNAANYVLGNRTSDSLRNFNGRIYFAYRWNRALSDNEIKSISANPYQIFKPVQRTFVNTLSAAADAFQSDAFQTDAFQTSAGAGVNHATSGALVGPGATVAGTAARVAGHVTTGDLTGPGATLSGSASRFRAFDTSGVLTGQGSALSGSASRFRTFDTTGDLIGQGATVTGAANRFRAFDTSGVLNGPGAIIVGSAARSAVAVTHDTTGTLVGPGAAIVGQAQYISLYPDPSVVLAGVQYGPGGIYVGTLTVGVGQRIIRLRSFTESD